MHINTQRNPFIMCNENKKWRMIIPSKWLSSLCLTPVLSLTQTADVRRVSGGLQSERWAGSVAMPTCFPQEVSTGEHSGVFLFLCCCSKWRRSCLIWSSVITGITPIVLVDLLLTIEPHHRSSFTHVPASFYSEGRRSGQEQTAGRISAKILLVTHSWCLLIL